MGRLKHNGKNMKHTGKNTKHAGKNAKRTAWKKAKHKNSAAQKRRAGNQQSVNRQSVNQRTENQWSENRQTEPISAGPVRDGNSRMIFKNSKLCAQFIRDNFDIPVLKDIKPEDISDVTEKYRAYLGIHFEADTVKKIRLPGEETPELFLVSLIEHKSKVDYNIAMQLLRYMVCIWTEYAREMEARQAGISRTKGFRYPPILPIVYYEGIENWTADQNLRDRIALKDIFGEYFPDFTYKVVRIHDYTNEELLGREDEMSFLMMVNRIQTPEDLSRFLQVEPEAIKKIVEQASPQILEIFAETIWSLCMKMNVPLEQAEECVKKVKERDMGYLFENMEKMDIQEERRKTQEAQKQLEEAQRQLQRQAKEAQRQVQKQVEEAQLQAQRQVEEAQRQAEEAQRRADEIQRRAKEAQRQVEEAKKERSRSIRNLVKLCQRLGTSKETAVRELSNAYDLDRDTALKEVQLYWND